MSTLFRVAAGVAVLGLLSACGGGGGGSTTSATTSPVSLNVPVPQTVSTSDALTFTAKASSSAGTITKMFWQIETQTLGANPLTGVTNADCKTVTTDSSGTTCALQVSPPATLTADYTYKISFFAYDSAGNSNTGATTLKVLQSASTTNNPVAKTGADVTVTSGDKVSLTCAGSGGTPASSGTPYAYQWVVSDAAGLTLTLANAGAASASFVAPVVTQATAVKLQCRVTDDKQRTGTATQTITINPVVKPTVVPISYSGGTVQPGTVGTLDGSKSAMYDANGNLTTGTLYYLWQYKSGPSGSTPLSVNNAGSAVASVLFPSVVTTTSTYVFTLNVSTSPIAPDGTSKDVVKQLDVLFYVSALPQITLTPVQQIIQVRSGDAVQMQVNASASNTVPVYYAWTQISGSPLATLVGANSSKAGFIAPAVSATTTMMFRASASYQPVTVSNPGDASADLIVQIQP